MAYRTTPQTSTGESPFYLLYGQDAKVPSTLDFYIPRPPAVTIESEYGRELFQELKAIRELARQHIKRTQISQKEQYEKRSKEPIIKVSDLVMLKVDPKFKLDHSFRGPYRVHSVTATCACIQPVNCPDKEKIFVSLQRLSRCNTANVENAKPWLGHGKGRKCRQIRHKTGATGVDVKDNHVNSSAEVPAIITRRGRKVKKPVRFRVNFSSCPKGQLANRGEVVKDHEESRAEQETRHHMWK